jgi:cytochrome c-L
MRHSTHPARQLLAAVFAVALATATHGQGPSATDKGEAAPEASGQPLEFTDLFGSPIAVDEPRPDEEFTPEVESFHRTGENPYAGDEAAVEEGSELYQRNCSSCHMRDATGGMGPSLVDDTVRHERVATDKGFFEVVHGGASGAMPAFGERLDQEQILKILAFVDSLREE